MTIEYINLFGQPKEVNTDTQFRNLMNMEGSNKMIIKFLFLLILLGISILFISGCVENESSTDGINNSDMNDTTNSSQSNDTINEKNDNSAPFTPSVPIGVNDGCLYSQYCFSQNVNDPDGNFVKCRFNWGDGACSDWSDLMESGQLFSQCHIWSSNGVFEIKIQAMDEYGLQSQWSNPSYLTITETEPDTDDINKLDCATILLYFCSPQENRQVNLQPNLKIYVNEWSVPEFGNSNRFVLTWYFKMNDEWVQIIQQTIFEGGSYYCYCPQADEYSTKYYWRATLENESGGVCDDFSFSFTTVQNRIPMFSSFNPSCNSFGQSFNLQPTLTVGIYDPNGDEMSLSWYEQNDGVWILTRFEQHLSNGTYSHVYESATQYQTKYYWKVIVADEHGLSQEEECHFNTVTPSIIINNISPQDETTFYIFIGGGGTTSVVAPSLVFNATISNSEGNIMDIKFHYYSQSTGDKSYEISNVGNGTYQWTPTEKLIYLGDSYSHFYISVTDLIWGAHVNSNFYYINTERVYMILSKNDEDNTLTVIELLSGFPSDFGWEHVGIGGMCTLPSGTISVGDVITNCSDELTLYWTDVDLAIGTWTFT